MVNFSAIETPSGGQHLEYRTQKGNCFYCGAAATDIDHVPPQCFFPKDKDLPAGTPTVRKNLITVPACDAHNGKYSKDDEVASMIVRLSGLANRLGQEDFITKGMRAINRSKGLVASVFVKIQVLRLPNGTEIPTMQFNAERVNRVMDRIAKGLFFHDFGRRWQNVLEVVADGPMMPDLSANPLQQAIDVLHQEFRGATRQGDNPDVFWYEWAVGLGDDDSHMLRMCFFDGLRYLVVPQPHAQPTPGDVS